MEVMVGMHAGQSQERLVACGRCRSTSLVRGDNTGDTRSHRLPGAQLLVGSSENWSVFQERPQHRMPQEGSG